LAVLNARGNVDAYASPLNVRMPGRTAGLKDVHVLLGASGGLLKGQDHVGLSGATAEAEGGEVLKDGAEAEVTAAAGAAAAEGGARSGSAELSAQLAKDLPEELLGVDVGVITPLLLAPETAASPLLVEAAAASRSS